MADNTVADNTVADNTVADDTVADPVPVARSPIAPAPPVGVLAGWEVSLARSDAALTLADWTPLAKVLVHAEPDSPPVRFGSAARSADTTLVVGWAPGQSLLLGAPGSGQDLVALRPGDALDLTSAFALLRLTGAQVSGLLAKVCALDLARAPDGAVFRSSVAKVAATLVRDDRAGVPSYLVACDRSLGAYLHGALLDAGGEFGIEPTGFDGP